jgi:hypothetical protein
MRYAPGLLDDFPDGSGRPRPTETAGAGQPLCPGQAGPAGLSDLRSDPSVTS